MGTIPAGQTSAPLVVTIVDDATAEAAEGIVVSIGGPVNAVKGGVMRERIVIQRSDGG